MNYFAYASNMNKKLMKERCPASKPRFPAVLPNHKLVFAGWSRQWRGGYATIKRVTGAKVRGAVYEISDDCLRRLDKIEGYPGAYDRQTFTVFTEDNEPVEAVVYFKPGQLEEALPSKEYAAVIQQGYRDWGLV